MFCACYRHVLHGFLSLFLILHVSFLKAGFVDTVTPTRSSVSCHVIRQTTRDSHSLFQHFMYLSWSIKPRPQKSIKCWYFWFDHHSIQTKQYLCGNKTVVCLNVRLFSSRNSISISTPFGSFLCARSALKNQHLIIAAKYIMTFPLHQNITGMYNEL